MSENNRNNNGVSKDDFKGLLYTLAAITGITGIGVLLSDAIDRRDRIQRTIRHAKSGNGVDALFARQRKFEHDLSGYQHRQHQHFEERQAAQYQSLKQNFQRNIELVGEMLTAELKEINKRIDALATSPSESKPNSVEKSGTAPDFFRKRD